jgi:acyl dehydratase
MNEVWKKPPISLAAYQNMVGHEVGVSSWHLVDQGRINVYADVIEDHQFIHIDPERAKKETPFGSTVAHGFLTMSLMSIMSYEVMPVIEGTTIGVNYGFDRLRFISPVRAGSRRPRPVCARRSQIAQADRAAVAYQRHRRDRGRGKARSGRRLDRPYLLCLFTTRRCRA